MALTHEIVPFGGWENNLALSNESCELLVTLDVGPRVLSFAPSGGQNVFKIFDEQLGGVEEPHWQARGGHRLWLAPESYPFSYYPDNYPVEHEIHPNGVVTIVAPEEMPRQGFQKEVQIALHPTQARVQITHKIMNIIDEEQEVAAWALSVMEAGGVAIVPQPPFGAHPGLGPGNFLPNRSMILWPFTDLSDPRFHLGQKYWTLAQDPERGATKIGLDGPIQWAGYHTGETLFIKRFRAPIAGEKRPDRGSVFELFANEAMVELETISPIQTLKPGGILEYTEEWELFVDVPAFDPTDDVAIGAALKMAGVL